MPPSERDLACRHFANVTAKHIDNLQRHAWRHPELEDAIKAIDAACDKWLDAVATTAYWSKVGLSKEDETKDGERHSLAPSPQHSVVDSPTQLYRLAKLLRSYPEAEISMNLSEHLAKWLYDAGVTVTTAPAPS